MSKTEKSIKRYCRKVRRHIICAKSTFDKWEKGYVDELFDRFSEQDDLSYDEVEHELGKAADMANLLQDNISPEEYAAAKRQKNIRVLIILLLLVILIGFLIYLLLYPKPVSVTETIIVNERIE